MAEEVANITENTPSRRAAQARLRADEARARISALRNRRLGVATPPAQYQEDLRLAMVRAQQAHEQLILALEASAVAHERASARYFQQANGDPLLEEKARRHLAQAEADWVRASELTET